MTSIRDQNRVDTSGRRCFRCLSNTCGPAHVDTCGPAHTLLCNVKTEAVAHTHREEGFDTLSVNKTVNMLSVNKTVNMLSVNETVDMLSVNETG